MKNKEFKLLDHGYLKYIDHMGTDESIIEAARMSTNKGFRSWDGYEQCTKCDYMPEPYDPGIVICSEGHHTFKVQPGDANLLDFLWRKKHATPFEMCELAIEVQCPIAVAREWLRSRTQSYNELSGRYVQMPNLHYLPAKDRFIPPKTSNKQAQGITAREPTEDEISDFLLRMGATQVSIYDIYEDMLGAGVPKEVARFDTPVSRYTRFRAKTDLRNWLGFCNLRKRPNAQYEIRVYADALGELINQLFPRSWALFEEYDLYGVHFSRTEMQTLRLMLGELISTDTTIPENLTEMDVLVQTAKGTELLKGAKLKEFMEKIEKGGREILS